MINLNEEDFDPVFSYGYRKRMEEDSLSFVLRMDQWADHHDLLSIPFGGVVCRTFWKDGLIGSYLGIIPPRLMIPGSLSGITSEGNNSRSCSRENGQYLCDLHGACPGGTSFQVLSTFRIVMASLFWRQFWTTVGLKPSASAFWEVGRDVNT